MKNYINPLFVYSFGIVAIEMIFVARYPDLVFFSTLFGGLTILTLFYFVTKDPGRTVMISEIVKQGASVKVISIPVDFIPGTAPIYHSVIIEVEDQWRFVKVELYGSVRKGYICVVRGDALISAK